jgi:hypothetical protein
MPGLLEQEEDCSGVLDAMCENVHVDEAGGREAISHMWIGRTSGRWAGQRTTEELEQKVDTGRGRGRRRRGEGSHGTHCVHNRDASLVLLRWNLKRD